MMQRLVFLTIAVCLTVVTASQCPTKDADKTDCGVVGSTSSTCEAKGCCWSPSNTSGTPWCFYKAGEAPTCPLTFTSKGAPFTDEEIATMRKFYLGNIDIDGSGAVVAAPDYNTPGGSYYYHWERDGALSMGALLETAASFDEVSKQLENYAGWVAKVQVEADPFDQSVLAEPKYFIPNATVFSGGWCRPQNDGPGLRSRTLIMYAEALEKANQKSGQDLWKLIQTDLDWQAANWQAQGCDLWEEIRSDDFFWNRFTMRAALTVGAAYAKKQGDSARATTYANAASSVEATLGAHFQNGFIMETQQRQKDSAVIAALNHGYLEDGNFSPSGKEAAGTVATLNSLFCTEYAINQADTKNGIPGILYGRYQGDNYAGGNPWILLTSALAELLYRGATEVHTKAAMDTEAYATWSKVVDLPATFDAVSTSAALAGAADGVLTRLKHHVAAGGLHLNEQIDRNSGEPMAAHDLTWSYAATLRAVHARKTYYANAVEQL